MVSLSDAHKTYLENHGVDVALAAELGVRSILEADELPAPFAHLNGQGTPALLYPWRAPDGREWPQLHPDSAPVDGDGEPMKYVFPSKKHHPEIGTPTVWKLWEPDKPRGVLLVEGTKQALAAASTRPAYTVYGLAGCSNWYQDGAPIAHLDGLFDGLDVVVLFDGDLRTNPNVYDQAARMIDELPIFAGAASVKSGKPVGSRDTNLDDILGARPAGAPRERLLEGIIGAAKDKLGTRPSKEPPRGDAARLLNWTKSLSYEVRPATAARYLDERGPFAVHAGSRALYSYNADTGVYDYLPDGIGPALSLILGDYHKGTFTKPVTEALAARAELNGRVLGRDTTSRLIAVANGVLDPDTGEMVEKSPDHLLLGSWAVAYHPDATCPKILAYIDRHFPEQTDTVLDSAARMLNRVDDQDRAPFYFGPPRAGKSTMLRLFAALVGPGGVSAETLHQIVSSRFSAAELYGKALNVAADLSAEELSDTATFKALTGGDKVSAERKFEHPFRFRNHALLMFSANSVPVMPAVADAEVARFVPIYAGRSYLGHEDPRVEAELMRELPGLFAELVRRHQARRRPVPHPVVAAEFRRTPSPAGSPSMSRRPGSATTSPSVRSSSPASSTGTRPASTSTSRATPRPSRR